MLIVLIDGFTKFENTSQLFSFTNITSIVKKSNTSVNGKALIAVCFKLQKKAFAIAKSGLSYDADYKSVYVV